MSVPSNDPRRNLSEVREQLRAAAVGIDKVAATPEACDDCQRALRLCIADLEYVARRISAIAAQLPRGRGR